ncbi:pilus assembly protein [Ectothiorhodospira variabilis]|uniref:pilus assembly protein n=1 Tax=Ectothiorhodospira variabilis TaxID=505694 RepID=UPI001EFB9EF8|nr:PilC/PilY family type IV pilus protein [Ectothiorhodospira variabilis]MCG5493543.1 hypothetical protein [Ectothiorhodospira variabilis]MCG5502872.1 hypothetical protein [Ectothiorhodospira variabilis]MCG5506340.1 hypothetical protein [Ectothiorhodospira variabilis]
MPSNTRNRLPERRFHLTQRICAGTAGAVFSLVCGVSSAQVNISNVPLVASVGEVHPFLVLTPSVEWPTINSVANLDSTYSPSTRYVGYFDSGKCYDYAYHEDESERHFFPVSLTSDRTCNNDYWSGNFLNWVATQTVDPFRLALTGGYRVRDTVEETWLEKARHSGQGGTSIYPNRSLSSGVLHGATPIGADSVHFRIEGRGNQMHFRLNSSSVGDTADAFASPDEVETDKTYAVSVRVKVCDPDVGLETFCQLYRDEVQGIDIWKPEGLLQEYSERIQVATFGYLNDHATLRDGGVLRARKKWIGPRKPDGDSMVGNAKAEWDAATGVFLRNPDPADAASTNAAIEDSGVINYINKFGQMTDHNHKSKDPVSELYYAATRYLRGLGDVSAYSQLSGTAEQRYRLADGFPVITDWDDPVPQWCQPNAILGIGDIYTHRDKNLPGRTRSNDEPSMPPEVSEDDWIDVHEATQEVAKLEGITINTPFTGRENSAYMVGLAWRANLGDMRPDLAGGPVRAQTYWLDVLEEQSLEGMARNQFALAAKYGGMRLPPDVDSDNPPTSIPEHWWHTNGETLTPFGSNGKNQASFKRPDNFFLAGDAEAMVDSLRQAFAQIVADTTGSSAALAIDGAAIDDGARIYQVTYNTGVWTGELLAFDLDPNTGAPASSASWRATQQMPQDHADRNIHVHTGQSGSYQTFEWSNLGSAQQTAIGSEKVLEYLRGDASGETRNEGDFRNRTTPLGDIVHSQPVFVGAPDPEVYADRNFAGASGHAAFAASQSNRRPVVYVGSNSGMLHGFDADTGEEIYAFVPNAAIEAGMGDLADPTYEHRYFVDGDLTVADVYDGSAWRTVLVGSMGRGGRAVFALDITDPDNVQFLWERSGSQVPALGNVLGKPFIAPVNTNDWRVLIGNGPNGSNGDAALITLDVLSGSATTINMGQSGQNGLMGIEVWDSDDDGYFETVYGGDLKGNLWKVDVVSGTKLRLFTAVDRSGDPQAISAPPIAAFDPLQEETWVFFGTGQYLNQADVNDMQVQSWYGLIDDNSTIVGRSDLLQRFITSEDIVDERDVRTVEVGDASQITNKSGWYIDLLANNNADGERMIIANQLFQRALIGTTRIPDSSDPCSPAGRGFVYAIDPFTGARLRSSFFLVGPDELPFDGLGFSSPPSQPVFVNPTAEGAGPRMLTSLEDGRIADDDVQPSGTHTTQSRRMSWRELVGD